MSDDLISRKAAIAVADFSDYVGLSVEDVKKVTDEVVKRLKQLPSAEPERKEGEWILHINNLFPVESTIECNQCHECQPVMITSHYCPNCGADMRVKKKKEETNERDQEKK